MRSEASASRVGARERSASVAPGGGAGGPGAAPDASATKTRAASPAANQRPLSVIPRAQSSLRARRLPGRCCDREGAAELDEERLEREVRLQVQLLEQAPERPERRRRGGG